MQMETVVMTSKELSRVSVITKLSEGVINASEASKKLNLSVRQIKRLKVGFKTKGAKAFTHKGRGRKSNRSLKEDILAKVTELLTTSYSDFKPSFACEKLNEVHNIAISSEKIRQLMASLNLWKIKKRKANSEFRAFRERKECFGEMLQFDGSYHKWFENRASECCLLAAIDDATSKVTKASFGANESVVEVFSFWKSYVESTGKPLSIYADKYSTYKINHKGATDNFELLTQFQRSLTSLNIKLIAANSPQAKGRIERLFNTLQDRLVKELRLNNISSIEKANIFLKEVFIPDFNNRFAVVPASNTNMHNPLTELEIVKIDKIFSSHYERCISNDFTIRFKNTYLQLQRKQPTTVLRTDKVLIEERLDGSIWIGLRNNYLNFVCLSERPKKAIIKYVIIPKEKAVYKPNENHPWKTAFSMKQRVKVLSSL